MSGLEDSCGWNHAIRAPEGGPASAVAAQYWWLPAAAIDDKDTTREL
ncbi:MAG TPA: hypothetical protein VKT77_23160 [Chthonomonadaceae bacterium]|nr:hypothetical protein [Chthonomonadaceae bacterium]